MIVDGVTSLLNIISSDKATHLMYACLPQHYSCQFEYIDMYIYIYVYKHIFLEELEIMSALRDDD